MTHHYQSLSSLRTWPSSKEDLSSQMRRSSSPSSTPKSRMYGKTLSRHHYDLSLCLITMTYHYGPSLSRRQSVRSGGRGFLRGDATSRITCIRGTSISVLPLSPPRWQLGSLSYIYADNCAVADSNVRCPMYTYMYRQYCECKPNSQQMPWRSTARSRWQASAG